MHVYSISWNIVIFACKLYVAQWSIVNLCSNMESFLGKNHSLVQVEFSPFDYDIEDDNNLDI